MFDVVLIRCPHCGKDVEEQTKCGPCALEYHPLGSAPDELKVAVSDYPIECSECGGRFKVTVSTIASIQTL